MNRTEPPPSGSPTSSVFLIGRNSRGNWVVQDPRGIRGGLFVDRAQALKFAKSENSCDPQSVIMVPGVIELDMSASSGSGSASYNLTAQAQSALRRVA